MGNSYLKCTLHSYFPPFCSTLHWFPPSPRQYTGSLVENIILHISYSIIRPEFLRERKCCFWMQVPPGLLLIFFEWCLPFSLKCTEENFALAIVYFIEVEEGKRNYFNDKIWPILSSNSHLHKNVKASPNSSEDGGLKPSPYGQASVHGLLWLMIA